MEPAVPIFETGAKQESIPPNLSLGYSEALYLKNGEVNRTGPRLSKTFVVAVSTVGVALLVSIATAAAVIVVTSVNAASSGEQTPGRPQAQVNLLSWKLTLPVTKDAYFGEGGSSVAEILPGESCNTLGSVEALDNGYEDSNYFFRDGDEVVFVTPLVGGVTTPSSSYVRSELRELYEWSPCTSDGSANWAPGGLHVLSATLRVTRFYADDPQTVVGQIHAKVSSKALIKLQWDGPNEDVRAIVNRDPVTGNPFNLDFGLTPGVDSWNYTIRLENGVMTTTVSYDGTTVAREVTFGVDGMSLDWNNHEYYFKAGNYAQADKDSGGEFEVRFSRIEVSHPKSTIDLSSWKLTLPVTKDAYFGEGGSSVAEILPGESCNTLGSVEALDNGYEDSNYFFRDGDEVVFVTPLVGGVTTPSSSYVRSELRELYEWSPCDSDGSANWAPGGLHVLSATLRVTKFYADDPQTVVGQIHAKVSSKALIKLQWDGPNEDVRAIVNRDPVTGNPFNLDFGLTPGVDSWNYTITLEDGILTTTVSFEGTTETREVTFGVDGTSLDWNNHEYYFKAGNYAQADKDSGGEFEVRFSRIDVSHGT